ncbi:MAG: permease prefix domain 1-containing protein [Oscillospiraceae bacterium]|nr:permease prefix domain 1-containing protein [Oscillospiraceae bacterium]
MYLNDKLKRWADQASETILFKPQREAVREEFLCHLQDSYAAKLKTGLNEEEATAQVLTEMGKPTPVAEQMAILYRPFWGQVWKYTRWTKYLALICLAIALVSTVYSAASARLSYDPDAFLDNLYGRRVADIRPEYPLQLEDYTVSVHRMVLLDSLFSEPSSDENCRSAYFTLKISYSNPRLQQPNFSYNMYATDNLGNSYGIRNYSAEDGREVSGNRGFSDLFVTYMEMWISEIPPEASELTLRFDAMYVTDGIVIEIPTRSEYQDTYTIAPAESA